ncbi:MAG: sulfotransferase [Cyanobacteria bacterium P01_G01_bin.39]
MGNEKEAILKDLDQLKLGYQIKLYSTASKEWQPYFHELSLDSHQHNQLFLDHNRLIYNHKPSILLSGLALNKEIQVREIDLVSDNSCFSGKVSCPSAVLGRRYPNVTNSSNARWTCTINFAISEPKQNFDLVITLENNHKFIYKKIEFYQVGLSNFGSEIEQPINHKLADKIKTISLSRQLMTTNIQQGKNYLFAIGNARSGTTALGKLLNYSSEICLGIERYSNDDDISASSFTKKSFFDSESKNYQVRPHFYEKIKDKFKNARYLGDKRPKFTQSWKNTWLNLPQAKIVYIFRNIYDVACSYNTRAANAILGKDDSWSSKRDFSQAVRDWNEGLQEFQNLADFYDVYCVKYEDFFVDQSKMKHLFNYLQVNTKEPSVIAGMDVINKKALSLQTKSRNLSDSELDYIDSHSDFEAYNKVLAFYNQQFEH